MTVLPDDPDRIDLIAELDEPTPEQERIAAVLRDLKRVPLWPLLAKHADGCWQVHTGCLATRIRRTLTGEDPDVH